MASSTLFRQDERATLPMRRGDNAQRPLRIALIHTSDHGGGAEASTLSLHLSLRRRGHESYLFVGRKQTDHPGVIEIPRSRCFPGVLRGVRFLEQQFGWQYLYQPWFRTIDRLFPDDIDVVHFQSLWGGQHGYADISALPRLTRRFPSVMTLRDMWMLTGHCACPPLGCDRWQRGCGRCPDLKAAPAIPQDGTAVNWKRKRAALQRSRLRVVTVSDWLAGCVRQSPIFAGHEVHTVYNGVDPTIFMPADRAASRRQWDLPPDATVVMIAGQSVEGLFENGDGPADYALRTLKDCQRNVFLLAVGHSAEKVLALWNGPGRAVPFQTQPSNLAQLYNAADLVVVASFWETFGRIPAEAHMCGVPVVGFATGGIPEVVADGRTGLLAPSRDVAGLVAAVQTLIDQPELRRDMGTAATVHARARFSEDIITERYIQHYRAVLAERRAASHEAVR